MFTKWSPRKKGNILVTDGISSVMVSIWQRLSGTSRNVMPSLNWSGGMWYLFFAGFCMVEPCGYMDIYIHLHVCVYILLPDPIRTRDVSGNL